MKLIIFAWALTLVVITVQAQSNPWVARHGLTSAQLQSTFDSLVAQGYRLNYISGYTFNNDPRYAAIWEKKSSPAWIARHGMTSAQYQQNFNAYQSQGYRIVLVNGYTVNGVDYYVAIWDKSSAGAWVARHGMTASEYQTVYNNWVGQGYTLKHVSGYAVGSSARYAAIWERVTNGYAWVAKHGLTSADYQTWTNTYVNQGYRPVLVCGYQVNNVIYYAAIWDKSPSGQWVTRHGLTSSDYQTWFNTYTSQGYIPRLVSGYDQGQSDRYAALLVK